MKQVNLGQAMLEYILIFGFMSMLAMQFYKWGGKYLDDTVGSLGNALTQELTVGVCKQFCFFHGYANE